MAIGTVWITGAGSGIGRAAAAAFAASGARVALTGRRVDALEAAVAAIGPAAIAIPADLSDPEEVTRAHRAVEAAFGPVEVLVNNAGANVKNRHIAALSRPDLAAVLGINLSAPFLCAMAVLPGMRARGGGTLIHIASVAGTAMFAPGGAAYGASKAGVRMLSAHLNAEEGIHGIRSVCINPGEVATEIMDRRPVPPSAAERAAMLQAEDIAAACLFAATLPPRATVADMTVMPTHDRHIQAFAEGLQRATQQDAGQ